MNMQAYPYVFYNAKWKGYFVLLIGLGFLVVIGDRFIAKNADLLAILLLLLPASLFIWLGWKVINDNKPVLQFGNSGIWTRKLGDVSWQQITLTYRISSNLKAGTMESLVILDKATQKQIDWVPLSPIKGTTEKIKQLLANCKKARIV